MSVLKWYIIIQSNNYSVYMYHKSPDPASFTIFFYLASWLSVPNQASAFSPLV